MSTFESYSSSDIQVLEGLEAVRKRPGMYIGSTSVKGLHHTVWEIVDNSVDEFFTKHGSVIEIRLLKDGGISIKDYGRGIPIDMHEKMGIPTIEVVLTVLHAGGKFGGGGYKISGGLHGVGASVVNALSKRMTAEVRKNGKLYSISFEEGLTTSPLKEIGVTDEENGTTITYYPDPTIFKETTEFNFMTICNRMRESSFLNKGLKFVITDERVVDEATGEPMTEIFESEGLSDYVKFLNTAKKPLHKEIFYVNDTLEDTRDIKNDVAVEIALQYSDAYNKDGVHSYVNNVKTPGGGTHERGFKNALSYVIKEYILNNNLMKKDELPDSSDVLVGLTAIISVKLVDPEFEGQTKDKLGNTFVSEIVSEIGKKNLTQFLAENPQEAKVIVKKIIDSYEERMAARKARQENRTRKKSAMHGLLELPDKLADCASDVVGECEIFIVEGDSAGGSAKGGRNRETQAILPIRGKILNVEKAAMNKILANEEILAMSTAFGTGMGDEFDYDKRRYDKIIIMTDADIDGAHIRILLLTFFFRYMRPLIERRNVYIAQPPLYALKRNDKYLAYAYNDAELAEKKLLYPRSEIQRYKGLGEMNASQLEKTTMKVGSRVLIRVTIEQAEIADNIFSSLMGDDAEVRKEFIQKHGYKAKLDI